MENFCCCKELPETTKDQDLFNILSYLEFCSLSWSQCSGICTDDAPLMISLIKDCYTRQRKTLITTHCFLHQEVLVSKPIGKDLKQVLNLSVNIVNFIKQHPLKSRLFAKLCENMQKDHVTLLHTDIRWLLRRTVLTKVFEL